MRLSVAGRPRAFRPGWGPSLFTVMGVALLVGLGVWQVQRLAWKTALIERVEDGLKQPPMTLPAALDDPADWDYRPVEVTGQFDPATTRLLVNRTHDGRAGVHLVTLLRRADGAPVAIDRGWIPAETRAEDYPPPEGVVTLRGVARAPQPGNFMLPANPPDGDVFYTIEPTLLDPSALPVHVDLAARAGETTSSAPPIAGRTRVTFRNDHAMYATFWFTLAALLAIIFVVRSTHREEGADIRDDRDDTTLSGS